MKIIVNEKMFLITKLLLGFVPSVSFSDTRTKLGIPCYNKHFPKQKLSFIISCFTTFRETSYRGYVKYAEEFT